MRTNGTAPMFQAPHRKAPSARVWITVLFCVLLPPVGLMILWRGLRCPVRGKMLLSVLALISMTLMLTLYIGAKQNESIEIPQQVTSQYAVNDYSAGDTTVVTSTRSAEAEPTNAADAPEETPVPANPAE